MPPEQQREPSALLLPVHRLGDPAEILDGERLQGSGRGEVGDLGLDVRRQPRQPEEAADAHARTAVAAGGGAERQALAVDLLLDLQGQREFAGDARGLGTNPGSPPDAQFAAL